MNNFSLDDFFAAFKNMRANASSLSSLRGSGCCNTQPTQQSYCSGRFYDSPDETVTYAPQNNSCQGFTCRHTEVPQQTCQPQPQQTCQPVPRQTCQPQPQIPQRGCGQRIMPSLPQQIRRNTNINMNLSYTENKNSGIIDGPGNEIYDNCGNDVYGMGNKGIIDTDGNDIYALNYSINTFNTVNNFYRQEVIQPTPTPTPDPTTPTVTPPDPETPDEPAVDLMPLRNLLNIMDTRPLNSKIDEAELTLAMSNPHKADLDGDSSNISAEEMAVFNRIKTLNQTDNLLVNVMNGDYSNIDEATLSELSDLSNTIKRLAAGN